MAKVATTEMQYPVASLDLPNTAELTYAIYRVTPKVAQYWLDTYNLHNRNLVDNRAKVLAADMNNEDWKFNGDTIRFGIDPDGDIILLDGQHRLAALLVSGKTYAFLVVTGLEATTQETMDFGAKRSFADVLHLRGASSTTQLSALVGRIYQWENGTLRSGNSGRTKGTVAQLTRKWQELGDVSDHLNRGVTCGKRLHAAPSMFALCSYVFSEVEKNQEGGPHRTEKDDADSLPDTDFFFDRLYDGEALVEGNPILSLRNMFFNNQASKQRYSDGTLLAMTIKAWNYYREGKQLKVITWRSGGRNPEPFPEPH